MSDSGAILMTGVIPFTLERESTLMPSEFRERMSAKHRSHKTSVKSASVARSRQMRQKTATLRYSTENSASSFNHNFQIEVNSVSADKSAENVEKSPKSDKYYSARAEYEKVLSLRSEELKQNVMKEESYARESTKSPQEFNGNKTYTLSKDEVKQLLDNMSPVNNFETNATPFRMDRTFTKATAPDWEIVQTEEEQHGIAGKIELNDDMKFMLDCQYGYNRSEEEDSRVKTPPENMHIKDIMSSLEDWGGSKETIREKKYTVLPSINKTVRSDTGSSRSRYSAGQASNLSMNNQLDFSRDKIEEDADFFADFRVNTSNIKPTPRQDPLPPIKHFTDAEPVSPYRQSGQRKKKREKH
ncbi:uncharacterized protein LOC127842806 [Dreissena polymorpha]|uniref:Uncharacterized protein n=1 Tax=Dreissena polymorpha TaxID=45954 RepID=A0A9D4S152_DREPO|nr:uncharacterized protein LOC127842806 [Dreissena polymorpha]KAH3886543.1 hypothetical protein DPMN_010554 [Dreissena polymorpha]